MDGFLMMFIFIGLLGLEKRRTILTWLNVDRYIGFLKNLLRQKKLNIKKEEFKRLLHGVFF